MPLFDYRCSVYGHTFETLVRTAPGPGVLDWPVCGEATATRQFGAFATASEGGAARGPAPGG